MKQIKYIYTNGTISNLGIFFCFHVSVTVLAIVHAALGHFCSHEMSWTGQENLLINHHIIWNLNVLPLGHIGASRCWTCTNGRRRNTFLFNFEHQSGNKLASSGLTGSSVNHNIRASLLRWKEMWTRSSGLSKQGIFWSDILQVISVCGWTRLCLYLFIAERRAISDSQLIFLYIHSAWSIISIGKLSPSLKFSRPFDPHE